MSKYEGKDSRVFTLAVNGTNGKPTTITRASDNYFRVAVRNVGGTALTLAFDAGALADSSSSDIYILPVGESETFVLAPRQGIWVTSQGESGKISCTISEALPTKWMED